MAVTHLIPRIRRRKTALRGTSSGTTNPLAVFHDEMNRLFEDFSGLFGDGVLTLQVEKRSESKDTIHLMSECYYGRSEQPLSCSHPALENSSMDTNLNCRVKWQAPL